MAAEKKDQGPTESVENVIKMAEEQSFKTGRDRQAAVELATLKVLVEIKNLLRK